MITIENLQYAYTRDQKVLKDISLSHQKGEVLFLIGPNGSGKSTMINCLLGLLPIDSGKITINGTELAELTPKSRARLMAYVPQESGMRFPYTVFEVVFMGRAPFTTFYSAPAETDKVIVEKVLDTLGLMKLRDRPFNQLSGGEKRLVLIARALVMETPLIIMDEPDAGLDFYNENYILRIIIGLITEQNRTLVIATHRLNHPWFFVDEGIAVKTALLKDGEIVAMGEPKEVLTPQNIYTVYDMQARLVKYDKNDGETGHYLIPMA